MTRILSNQAYHNLFRAITTITLLITYTTSISANTTTDDNDRPNIIIMYTDEHNLRTLGCYRELMGDEQSSIWGAGNNVETPNIDSLAQKGALFSNFYAVVPVCSPSRASFLTGQYPSGNGVERNHMPLNKQSQTFADILRHEGGYHTSYIGKWHLNGEAKPGWEKPKRDFGFKERRYQWNRGHWKYLKETFGFNRGVQGYTIAEEENMSQEEIEEKYTTDFLFTKAIKFMKRQRFRNRRKEWRPYLLFLSIPDPHGPNVVRSPYDTMYDDMDIEVPETATNAFESSPAVPTWAEDFGSDRLSPSKLVSNSRQRTIRNIFGMIKCIDDNVGRLLKELRRNQQIERNTIIIFTSDHGDLLGEHARDNKGLPYITSAGVPFIMSYPGHVEPGRVIRSAYSTVDFAPTLLSLLKYDLDDLRDRTGIRFHGIDGSKEILVNSVDDRRLITSTEEDDVDRSGKVVQTLEKYRSSASTSQNSTLSTKYPLNIATDRALPAVDDTTYDPIRFMMEAKKGKWAAAFNRRFKLIVSDRDVPWLFDLERDPDEVNNVYGQPEYDDIQRELQHGLLEEMREYDFTLLENNKNALFWDHPACLDSRDELYGLWEDTLCAHIDGVDDSKCYDRSVQESCPVKCGICCKDSPGVILIGEELLTCNDIATVYTKRCFAPEVKAYCPVSCGSCSSVVSKDDKVKLSKYNAGGS